MVTWKTRREWIEDALTAHREGRLTRDEALREMDELTTDRYRADTDQT